MRLQNSVWPILIILFLTEGCASFIGEETQPVSVDTPSCQGASCRLTNSQGTYFVKSTPETVVINKAYSDLTMICEKDDKTMTSVHVSAANGATFGNILLGGIPGALIDGGSGAGYGYQGYLINGLKCSDSGNQTTTSSGSTSKTYSKSIEDRLQELKRLQAKGLVSDKEAKKKRQDIIDSM